jgi:hypothetical protein
VNYERKTVDRHRVTARWLGKVAPRLLTLGFKARDLDVLRWHDIDNLNFPQIGRRLKLTANRCQQIYKKARRRMIHPRLRKIVPLSLSTDPWLFPG